MAFARDVLLGDGSRGSGLVNAYVERFRRRPATGKRGFYYSIKGLGSTERFVLDGLPDDAYPTDDELKPFFTQVR